MVIHGVGNPIEQMMLFGLQMLYFNITITLSVFRSTFLRKPRIDIPLKSTKPYQLSVGV